MRISIETSKPHLVKELFKCMTKSHELQELENEELEDGQNCDFLHKNEPSFAELLNYMRLLWTSDNSVYVNVIYNIVLYPQFMLSKERCTTREYSIYKNVFNSKNYRERAIFEIRNNKNRVEAIRNVLKTRFIDWRDWVLLLLCITPFAGNILLYIQKKKAQLA